MLQITPLLLFYVFTIASHALFLVFAKRNSSLLRKHLWRIHCWLNGTLWFILIGWVVFIQFNSNVVEFSIILQVLGLGVFLLGLMLAMINLKRLGFEQAMGYRFFSQCKPEWIFTGIYSYLHNPIYDGFVLIFIGFGLWRGIVTDLYLGVISFLLLNVFLASIEKEKIVFKLRELF